jgi:hypothetical protein
MIEDKTERVDGLERYYKPIEIFERLSSLLFWVSAVLSIAVLYSRIIPWTSLRNVPMVMFSTFVVLHLVFTLYTKFNLIPIAEGKRRKQLLSNSFDVPLTPEETKAYYNNPIAPSIQRLGANILENSFFAKSICGKMALQERVKVLIYFTVWFVAAICRSTPLDILVVVTQTVFSGEIIARLVSLEVLRHRNEDLFEELYHEFLHKVDFQTSTATACILDAFATYESAKSAAAIKQSTSVFLALNPSLTREWAGICERLKMTR